MAWRTGGARLLRSRTGRPRMGCAWVGRAGMGYAGMGCLSGQSLCWRSIPAVLRATRGCGSATTLGATGWQTFWRVTLPSIRWGLLYGVLLCNARAMGEFGAVSVVSGHIRGQTNTLPLHVEVLYNEYNMAAAFACASILCVLGLVTLLLKTLIEWRAGLRRRTH